MAHIIFIRPSHSHWVFSTRTSDVVQAFTMPSISMVAGLLLRAPSRKPFLSLGYCVCPNLSSSALSSTHCRSKRFRLSPPPHPPPVARKVPFIATAHGINWKDPYRWMSNINDPDFITYIDRENAYAEAFMGDTNEMQRTLYSEMVSRMPSTISTPPERWGPWYAIFAQLRE